MHCLGCEYDLRGVPAGRCPERAREFDPARAETFGPSRRVRAERVEPYYWWAAVVACPGPLWSAVGMGAEYLLAWAVLGREPEPSRDDPKHLGPLVSSVHGFVGVGMCMSPVLTFGVLVAASMFLAERVGTERWLAMLVLALVAWPLAGLVWWAYPARVGTWWID